ncbi:MAG: DEAD/DEAH box helicase family protein, partial [Streptococcus sp.]
MIEAGGEKVIAKVIVDVPLMQTDKPYSYQIPSEFEDMVEAGMRVHVPFGKGNRLIQGIVVDVLEEADTSEELKAIVEVLDYTPVLNQEQFWLADQLRKSVFSYKITILKTMLPSLLNSSYDKILYPQPSLDPTLKVKLFGEKNEVSFSSLDAADQAQVMRLVRKGDLVLEYKAKDKKQIKTEKWYRVNQEGLKELQPSARAKKRLALKERLLLEQGEQPLAGLYQDFSREVVAYFIDQGVLEITEREVNRAAAYYEGKEQTQALLLNSEQAKAVETVVSQIGKTSKPFLLEGVTGSGKTEVYLQIIQEVLNKGKTAIMLVPEISLTPQMTDRFISRFGQEVAILHSGLSNGEKYDQWRKVERGEAKVVVGARSAIFAPLKNIGAIIIDEEHEASYKQDSNP